MSSDGSEIMMETVHSHKHSNDATHELRHHKEHIIHHTSKIIAKPEVHQQFVVKDGVQINTQDIERHPSWLELLFDLVIIIAARNLVSGYSSDLDRKENVAILNYIFRIIPILSIWSGVDMYLNRFGQPESIFDSIFIFVQFCIMSCIASTVDVYSASSNNEERFNALCAFTLGVALAHATNMLMNIRVACALPEARGFLMGIISFSLCSMVNWLLVSSIFHNLQDSYLLFAFASLFELCRPLYFAIFTKNFPYHIFNVKYTYIPLNIFLSMERCGLLVIIAIGEVIITVYGTTTTWSAFWDVVVTVILGFQYKIMFFDVFDCLATRAEKPALRVSVVNGGTYFLLIYMIVGSIMLSHLYLIPTAASEGHRRRLTSLFEMVTSSWNMFGNKVDADDHIVDDHAAIDDHATDDHTSEGESTPDRYLRNQTVFAVVVSVVTASSFLIKMLHQQSEHVTKSERIPPKLRLLLIIGMMSSLIAISSSVIFYDHRKFILITELFLVICMFCEYLAQSYFLDFVYVKKLMAQHLHLVNNCKVFAGLSSMEGNMMKKSEQNDQQGSVPSDNEKLPNISLYHLLTSFQTFLTENSLRGHQGNMNVSMQVDNTIAVMRPPSSHGEIIAERVKLRAVGDNSENSEDDKVSNPLSNIETSLQSNINSNGVCEDGELFCHPVVRQRFVMIDGKKVNTSENVEHRPSWLELLFDLVIIIASKKIVEGYESDVTKELPSAPLNYCVRLSAIISVWQLVDSIINRFGNNECKIDTIYMFMLFVCMAWSATSVEVYSDSTNNFDRTHSLSAFAAGINGCYLVTLVLLTRVAISVKETRTFIFGYIVYLVMTCSIWTYLVFLPSERDKVGHRYFIAASIFDFLREPFLTNFSKIFPYETVFGLKYEYIPVNIFHMMERGGLLIILSLGEVMDAIYGDSLHFDTYKYIIVTVIIGFLFKFAYFDVFDCMGEHVSRVSLKVSKFRGITGIKMLPMIVGAMGLSRLYLMPDSEEYSHRRLSSGDDDSMSEMSERDMYMQNSFACSISIGFFLMYMFNQLHEHSEIGLRCQLVPRLYRGLFIFISCVALIVISATRKFESRFELIGLAIFMMALCLLVEFFCQWIFLDYDYLEQVLADGVDIQGRKSEANNKERMSLSARIEQGQILRQLLHETGDGTGQLRGTFSSIGSSIPVPAEASVRSSASYKNTGRRSSMSRRISITGADTIQDRIEARIHDNAVKDISEV